MSYKKYFEGILFICIIWMFGTLCCAWLIDPIGIWGGPVIQGFNHYKVKQSRYEDVFKVYEIMRVQPDVVYIGSSEVDRGFDASEVKVSGVSMYNMGFGSGRLWDIREYLRFIYKTCKPKVVYFGCNPYMFTTVGYSNEQKLSNERPSFSVIRLQNLAGHPIEFGCQLIKDSLGIHDVYISTVFNSMHYSSDKSIFRMGWNSLGRRGKTIGISKEHFYTAIGDIIESHEIIQYSSEAVQCFVDIVNEAKENDVGLCVFFTPVTVDRYALYPLMGYNQQFREIKEIVSRITPVYDFYFVNDLSINRKENFYDSGHFRAPVGEIITRCLESRNPSPYGYLLTAETVEAVLAAEDTAWEQWKANNQEYVNILNDYIQTRRRPKVGAFEKYIGF